MNTEMTPSLSELAKQLKEAGPLESPALARQISEQVEALRPHISDWQRSANLLGSVSVDPGLLKSLEGVAQFAREIQVDRAELEKVAAQVRELRESGVLEQVLRYQQQLAEVLASIHKITGR